MKALDIFYNHKDELEKAFQVLKSDNNYIFCVKNNQIYGFNALDLENNTLNVNNDKAFKNVDSISIDTEDLCISYAVDGTSMVYHPDY